MIPRRRFLAAAAAAAASGCLRGPATDASVLVNDIHSGLNATRVARVVRPASVEGLAAAVRDAASEGRALCIAGGRHAMGGQQFAAGGVLVDMGGMRRVIVFDPDRGHVDVEAGIQWPELVDHLLAVQRGGPRQWGIVQKQTGADRLSIGGALAANVHGRGLTMRPMVGDVESFTLVGPDGVVRRCSRTENPELFALAIGGYGLVGIIATVRLRLARRRKLERVVQVIEAAGLAAAFERRIAEGFAFGDFQYATDPATDLLRRGVFSCYRPLDDSAAMPEAQPELAQADWERLLLLSHADKRRAFELYAGYYLATSGQRYWSDTHQMGVYIDGYHRDLDRQLGAAVPGSEMITELYVPRPRLGAFFEAVRGDVVRESMAVIYGTVRLIARDPEAVLTWAREDWACVIVNLHVDHSPAGLEKAARDFRRLIDRALEQGGSYFLTYHRWAERRQVEQAHPRLVEFLRAKRRLDPQERFQSEWYRHHRAMLLDRL